MPAVVTYEVHALRGKDWIIDLIAENRIEAMERARLLVAQSPEAAIQVVEERYNPDTGDVSTTVLLRAVPKRKDAVTFRTAPRKPAEAAAARPRAAALTVTRIALIGVIALGLIALGRLTTGW